MENSLAFAFDPVSTTFAVGAAASSALIMLAEHTGLTTLRCRMGIVECCCSPHVRFNATGDLID